MIQHFYILLFINLLAFSCQKDEFNDASCFYENPIEKLDWLSPRILELDTGNLSKFNYVKQADYEGSTLFIFGNCCPFCNSIFYVYDCTGKKIGHIGNNEGDFSFSILDNAKVIWSPVDSQCNFN